MGCGVNLNCATDFLLMSTTKSAKILKWLTHFSLHFVYYNNVTDPEWKANIYESIMLSLWISTYSAYFGCTSISAQKRIHGWNILERINCKQTRYSENTHEYKHHTMVAIRLYSWYCNVMVRCYIHIYDSAMLDAKYNRWRCRYHSQFSHPPLHHSWAMTKLLQRDS